jgi:hypothetical protein
MFIFTCSPNSNPPTYLKTSPLSNVANLVASFHFLPNVASSHHNNLVVVDAPPSSLCDPKRVQKVGFVEMVRNLVPLPASNTKRGRGVVLEAPGLD